MSTSQPTATARVIRNLAIHSNVVYRATATDRLASDITRVAGDEVDLDNMEQLLVGLQRIGRIDRRLMVRLQARYLRESKP